MRFFVESWAPEYGTPAEEAMAASTTEVEVHLEVAADQWAPVSPDPSVRVPDCIVFVDGVRRVDARVWVDGGVDGLRQGVCATYAAGAVRCNGRAELTGSRVERGVFCCGVGF